MTDTPARDAVIAVAANIDRLTSDPRSAARLGIYLVLDMAWKENLAALVEAHGLDEVLRALGGEMRQMETPKHHVPCEGWHFPTKETTDE